MNTYAFSIRESIKFGWEKTKENFVPILLAVVGVLVIIGILDFLGSPKHGRVPFMELVSFLFRTVVSIGFVVGGLNIVRGMPFGFENFKVSFETFWRYIVANFLYMIAVGVGLVLLIVPGIYIALRYGFVNYLIVDKQMGIRAAFERSSELTNGIKRRLFKFGLVMIGMNILGLLALGIGLVVSVPVSFIASLWVYNEILKQSTTAPATPVSPAPHSEISQVVPLETQEPTPATTSN